MVFKKILRIVSGGTLGENKHRKLFKKEEWALFLRIGKSLHDQEQKQAFFEATLQKKYANSRYSLFDDFPGDKTEWQLIAGEILETVKAINEKKKVETKTYLPPRSGELAAWGESFGAVVDAELERMAREAEEKKAGGE
jgi:hypothetical protein